MFPRVKALRDGLGPQFAGAIAPSAAALVFPLIEAGRPEQFVTVLCGTFRNPIANGPFQGLDLRGSALRPPPARSACRRASRQTASRSTCCACQPGPLLAYRNPARSEDTERIHANRTESGTGTRRVPYRAVPRALDTGASSCPCPAPRSVPEIPGRPRSHL